LHEGRVILGRGVGPDADVDECGHHLHRGHGVGVELALAA
jgi:hypothetical protein